jgi:aminoglycoside 3-N-acetyltransferase I
VQHLTLPSNVVVRRLTSQDADTARALFTLMADVFGETHDTLSSDYVNRLLAHADFWALGALVGDRIVGGLTAHTLQMTTRERAEIFIYDIAVHADHQRRSVGSQLIRELQRMAGLAGIDTLFVPADNQDIHALDFYRSLGATGVPITMFEFRPL